MPTTHALLRGEITYEEARQKETNILHHLTYPIADSKLLNRIHRRRGLLEKLVAHHLDLPSSACHVAHLRDWMSGSFNLCVPVTVADSKRVIIRFPLGYRIAEETCPGNGDEKLRCEAAAYVWITENCLDVPVPHLYGFALSNGRSVSLSLRPFGRRKELTVGVQLQFTAVKHRPLLVRLFHRLRCQVLSCLGRPVPSNLIPHQTDLSDELGGYLLIEYIDESQGEMLSNTWETGCSDERLRRNLYRGLSQAMLRIARIPLPRIGSFIIDDHGFLHLANRPLTLEIVDLENDAIPINIPRERVYHTVDSYVNDLLSCHDKRLRFQPNAVHDGPDAITQMSALTIMRAMRPDLFDPYLNSGPFHARLTDTNGSNLIVDKDWNIKCFIDLEWTAVLPAEFMQPPTWLTSQAVDEICIEEYDSRRREFMEIFEEEEQKSMPQVEGHFRHSSTMRASWDMGTFWYVLALRSPTGLHSVFYDRMQPLFSKEHGDNGQFYVATYPYWTRNVNRFLVQKIQDKENYDKKLQAVFDVA